MSAYFADLEVSIRSEKLLTNSTDQDPFGPFPTLRWGSANRRGSPLNFEGVGGVKWLVFWVCLFFKKGKVLKVLKVLILGKMCELRK